MTEIYTRTTHLGILEIPDSFKIPRNMMRTTILSTQEKFILCLLVSTKNLPLPASYFIKNSRGYGHQHVRSVLKKFVRNGYANCSMAGFYTISDKIRAMLAQEIPYDSILTACLYDHSLKASDRMAHIFFSNAMDGRTLQLSRYLNDYGYKYARKLIMRLNKLGKWKITWNGYETKYEMEIVMNFKFSPQIPGWHKGRVMNDNLTQFIAPDMKDRAKRGGKRTAEVSNGKERKLVTEENTGQYPEGTPVSNGKERLGESFRPISQGNLSGLSVDQPCSSSFIEGFLTDKQKEAMEEEYASSNARKEWLHNRLRKIRGE